MILSTLSHSVWCVSVPLLVVVGAVHASFSPQSYSTFNRREMNESVPPTPHFGFSRPRLNPFSVCVCVTLSVCVAKRSTAGTECWGVI